MRRLLLVVPLLALTPARAAPRLTVRLENASVTEAARRLEAFYGVPVILPIDRQSGKVGVSPRATLDWHEATLGQVVDDMERAFRLQATTAEDATIRLAPVTDKPGEFRVDTAQATVTLREVQQTEMRRKLVGAGTTEVERSLRLTLAIRPKAGEPEAIRGVVGLTVIEQRGRRSEGTGTAAPIAAHTFSVRPDERVFQMDVPMLRTGTSGFLTVEGQVLVSPAARTYRVEFTGPEHAADRGQAGPVRIEAAPEVPRTAAVSYTLSWPRTIRIDVGSGGIRCFRRKGDGSTAPITLAGMQSFAEPDGGGSARVILTFPAGDDGTLVWDVTTLDPQDVRVPFRFQRVVLPLAAPAPEPAPAPRK